jgi:hypothetical protein
LRAPLDARITLATDLRERERARVTRYASE